MLVAPAVPSPPPSPIAGQAPAPSPLVRPILAGAGVGAPSTRLPGKESRNGASAFAIFRDGGDGVGEDGAGGYEDMGTVKSRKKENEVEVREWAGEKMPMTAPKPATGFKLEIFRDAVSSPNVLGVLFGSSTDDDTR